MTNKITSINLRTDGEPVAICRISNGGIDFLVNEDFLEWHPIVFMAKKKGHGSRGDIPTQEEYDSYKRVNEFLSKEERVEFYDDYKRVIEINYLNSRQSAIDSSDYLGKRVYLATNPLDLYNFILRHSDTLPEFSDFNREFNQTIKYVKKFKSKPKEEVVQAA